MNPNMSPTPILRRSSATLRNFIAPIALALLSSASAQPLVTNEPGGPTKPFKPSVRIKAEGPLAYMLVGQPFFRAMEQGRYALAGTVIRSDFQSRERFMDGQWIASMTLDAYAQYLKLSHAWDEQWAVIQSWRHAEPKNGDAAIVEATYWLSYAWYTRGDGPSHAVPPPAMRRANEHAAKARKVLEAAKPYASSNPAWYASMLDIAVLQRWPLEKRLALFDEAVKAEPYYYPTYFHMATSLMPRWGGKLADYHRFVETAVITTKPIDGNSMYARLYWHLSDNGDCCQDMLLTSGIPWQKMKSGFDDVMQRYPGSQWNRQHYAYFACRESDRKAFLELLPTLDQTVVKSFNVWRGSYTLDYCKDQFTLRS
jgi:hypothetical protein